LGLDLAEGVVFMAFTKSKLQGSILTLLVIQHVEPELLLHLL
jgi:hypothetical protein